MNQIIVSHKVAEALYLVGQSIPRDVEAKPRPVNSHHFAWIDCSGSMYTDLPKIGHQFKNKIPTLVKPGNTLTIGWFSGRNQCGILVEAAPVETLLDLQKMNEIIDRFLRPIGLTGFKDPLVMTKEVIGRIRKNDPDGAISMFFMTDGWDNQSTEKEIMAAVVDLESLLASATFVEYGWYANRALLTKMASEIGGSLLFSENFNEFEPLMEKAVTKGFVGAKRKEIALAGKARHGIVFTLGDGEIVSFVPDEDAKIRVQEGTNEVFFLSDKPIGQIGDDISGDGEGMSTSAAYAALHVLSQRMLADDVFHFLRAIGDVALIKRYTNGFGKQQGSAFQAEALQCAFDEDARFSEGYNPNAVADEDAYNVLTMLEDLRAEEGNLVMLGQLKYNRIGRKRVQHGAVLTDEEMAETQDLMAKAKTPADLKAAQARIDAILAAKSTVLEFKSNDKEKGVPVSALVTHEDRPNVSILTRQEGTVELPENDFGLPKDFGTYIYRNYAIIRDGIINVKLLPMKLAEATFLKLLENGVVSGEYDPEKVYELDLREMPIINRRMVKSVSAEEIFRLQFELTKLKAQQKVFKFYRDQFTEKVSHGFAEAYGAEAAGWLKEIGITDFNGFNPKSVQAEASDMYKGVELAISVKGLSSLPSVNEVLKKLASGKTLTARERLLSDSIREYESFRNALADVGEEKRTAMLKEWLDEKTTAIIKRTRAAIRRISEIKFGVVVGQVWFKEFSTIEENSMTLDIDGEKITFTANLNEIEEKV